MSELEPVEPSPPRRRTAAGTAALQLLVVFGVLGPLFAAGALLQRDEGPSGPHDHLIVPITVAVIGTLALALTWLALRVGGESWRTAGAAPEPLPRAIGLGLLVALGGYVAAGSVSLLYVIATGFDLAKLMSERTESLAGLGSIPTAIVVPLAIFVGFYEELLFRGFMQSRLRTLFGRFGPAAADVASVATAAALFGLAHAYQGTIGVLQTSALALVFGGVTLWRGNVWACVAAHAAIDVVGLLLVKKLLL